MRFVVFCMAVFGAGCSSPTKSGQLVPIGGGSGSATSQQSSRTPSKETEATPTDAEVSGFVRYKDQPLAGATVFFHSENGSSGTETQTDGSFRLTAKPGSNKVTVEVKMEREPTAPKAKLKQPIPDRYSQVETTDLIFSLSVGKNSININLQ